MVIYLIALGTILVFCLGCCIFKRLSRLGCRHKGTFDDCDISCYCDCECCKPDYPAATAYACNVPVPPNAEITQLPVELELDSIVFIVEPIEAIDNAFRR
jgi:hypothetical protein